MLQLLIILTSDRSAYYFLVVFFFFFIRPSDPKQDIQDTIVVREGKMDNTDFIFCRWTNWSLQLLLCMYRNNVNTQKCG